LVSTHALLQFSRGAGHAPQTPFPQNPPPGQRLPQVPQLAGSDRVSTQRPPHSVVPPAQTMVQTPFSQA
jgi:hypothetical protein